MKPVRRAVIDIGTNSIKLLVADVTGQQVQPVLEQSKQTRLGSGFYKTRRLQAPSIESTAGAVAQFVADARAHQAGSIRIVATSAAREALNADDLTTAVRTASGLEMEIISGDQEADWVFQGVTTDPVLAKDPLLILDVGGGSTEFILGHGHQKHFRASFPIGTVRLLEQIPHTDPPAPAELLAGRGWLKTFLDKEVRPHLDPAIRKETASGRRPLQLVGTGGTASILARMELELDNYDRGQIEACQISLDRVRSHTTRLWRLPLAERRQIIGLPPNRADVILTGLAIYESIMEQFGFSSLRVSTRGLRFAAVLDPTEPLSRI